jgi:hypothetical protein
MSNYKVPISVYFKDISEQLNSKTVKKAFCEMCTTTTYCINHFAVESMEQNPAIKILVKNSRFKFNEQCCICTSCITHFSLSFIHFFPSTASLLSPLKQWIKLSLCPSQNYSQCNYMIYAQESNKACNFYFLFLFSYRALCPMCRNNQQMHQFIAVYNFT